MSGAVCVSARRVLFLFCLVAVPSLASPAGSLSSRTRSIIVDTDAATDDMIALAMLLARPDLHIDAITIANGEAHVEIGAQNVLRLLTLAGRPDIPVYIGSARPMKGNAAFPPSWRELCDTLPGVHLPPAARAPSAIPAAEFLASRLAAGRPEVEVLTIGPLTNLGETFLRRPEAAKHVKRIVAMGGAIRVRGNVRDGWPEANDFAEFNIFIDPEAARIVFKSGASLLLVPLDATNHVPIDSGFVAELQKTRDTPLGQFVLEVLAAMRAFVSSGKYFAWDPLTAAVFIKPSLAATTAGRLVVSTDGDRIGRVHFDRTTSLCRVATSIDESAFRRMLVTSLSAAR